jgi:hypothetical protein
MVLRTSLVMGSLWATINITQNSPFEGCAIPPLVVGWGRRYIGHEVEGLTPVLGKLWALKRAREASSATGYRAEIPE